jgi:hypothetical protein
VNSTTQSLLKTADLIARQGGLDPHFHALAMLESWRAAKPVHFRQLALNSGLKPIDEVQQRLFLAELERRAAS